MSLVLPLFSPARLLTLVGDKSLAKSDGFCLVLSFHVGPIGSGGEAQTWGQGALPGCVARAASHSRAVRGGAASSVGSRSKDDVGERLGVCCQSDRTCPLLFWCCACSLCAPCPWTVWIADEYGLVFLQFFFFFVSLLKVYFTHLKLDSGTLSLLFLPVLCLRGSPGLALWYPTVNNLAPSEEMLNC